MAFLDRVLQVPSYGWMDQNGDLIKPTTRQSFSEFFSRLNVFKDKRNWLPFFSWLKVLCLAPFFTLFLVQYFSLYTLLIAFLYSMIIMGTHGTIWHHRYCTHGAYKFRNHFWRFFLHWMWFLKRSMWSRIMCIIPNPTNRAIHIMPMEDFYIVF